MSKHEIFVQWIKICLAIIGLVVMAGFLDKINNQLNENNSILKNTREKKSFEVPRVGYDAGRF